MENLDPTSILGPDGVIAKRLSSYEHRDEQLAMAGAVARAIEKPSHLVVEAGTGVGKSFAYLVPAIQAAVVSRIRRRSSFPHIQSPFRSNWSGKDDIPFLPLGQRWGRSSRQFWSRVRSNYISLRRLDIAAPAAVRTVQAEIRDVTDQLNAIGGWAKRTKDGSRSDLDYRPYPTVWEAVQSEDGNCLGKQCPRHAECFFYAARRRATELRPTILIVNHALFVTDLALREEQGIDGCRSYDVAHH